MMKRSANVLFVGLLVIASGLLIVGGPAVLIGRQHQSGDETGMRQHRHGENEGRENRMKMHEMMKQHAGERAEKLEELIEKVETAEGAARLETSIELLLELAGREKRRVRMMEKRMQKVNGDGEMMQMMKNCPMMQEMMEKDSESEESSEEDHEAHH